ncbi:unnamed protein product, partial [marine sediment metagenome]
AIGCMLAYAGQLSWLGPDMSEGEGFRHMLIGSGTVCGLVVGLVVGLLCVIASRPPRR